MTKRYNQRQRKKLHLGEFQEFAFSATAEFRTGLSGQEREALLDAFIAAIEAHELLAAVSTIERLDAYVISGALRGSATKAQREWMRTWLESRPELTGVQVGELTDAWYPPTDGQ